MREINLAHSRILRAQSTLPDAIELLRARNVLHIAQHLIGDNQLRDPSKHAECSNLSPITTLQQHSRAETSGSDVWGETGGVLSLL